MRERIEDARNVAELLLPDLEDAHALACKRIGDGLDGRALACAGISGEEDIGSRKPLHERAGVVEDDLLLALVVDKIFEPLRIGMLDRHDLTLSIHAEHIVAGIHAVAILADVRDAVVIGACDIDLLRIEGRKTVHSSRQKLEEVLGLEVGKLLEDRELCLGSSCKRGTRHPPGTDGPKIHILVVDCSVQDVGPKAFRLGVEECCHESGIGTGKRHCIA